METRSLNDLVQQMQRDGKLWKMGHGENQLTGDLGLGWLYYGLTRALKPNLALVIGSWRGFVPMLIGQALQESVEGAQLHFIDPSLADEHWEKDVDQYFIQYGIHCIQHHHMTSEAFLASSQLQPESVDLLFIDGLHTYDQCKLEHEGFQPLLSRRALVLFHDSTSRITSGMYGNDKSYRHSVWKYIEELERDSSFRLINLDIAQGLAIVQSAH